MKCGMCKYFEKDKRYCFGYCQKMNGKNVENYDNCHCNGFIHKYNELDIRKCIRDCRCKVCDKNVKNEDVVYIKSFRLNAQPFHICLDCWAKINSLVDNYKLHKTIDNLAKAELRYEAMVGDFSESGQCLKFLTRKEYEEAMNTMKEAFINTVEGINK